MDFMRLQKNNSQAGSPISIHKRSERRLTPELAAYHWAGSAFRQESVYNISSSGLYLQTDERWEPGQVVSLTFQRKGPPEKESPRRIAVQARAVRCGRDGVGLSFELPSGMDLHFWESPLKSASEQTEPEDILSEFRLAEAISFLAQICPSDEDAIRGLLREGLSNYRVMSAIEIVLRAKELVGLSAGVDKVTASSRVILRILQDGSWADTESIQQLWAGLLATACSETGGDDSNLTFVNLFSQLTPGHIRLLAAACTRSPKILTGTGKISSRPVDCTTQELMRFTGLRDVIRIDRDIEFLSDLGLFMRRVKTSFFTAEDAKIAPTTLGLLLYARCNGFRGTPQDFYGVTLTDSHAMAAGA
ncbi:MAG TPA: PilZ domain-containing protein [Terracidiphilus sp.]|nr:PilZ domain-containing protein [Terracidiphilus sp.]